MENVTGTIAGAERRTVNVAVADPLSPSATDTSSIEIAGRPSHGCSGEPMLRGSGAAAEKSPPFESVSAQPASVRNAAVAAASVGAAAPPSKKFALPYPTRSRMRTRAAALQGVEPPLQPSDATPVTSATFPAPTAMAIGVASTRSDPGSDAPVVPPDSWTR